MNKLRKIQNLCKRLSRSGKAYLTDSQNMLINWSDFKKGRLILFFGILSQIEVARWYLFSYYSDEKIKWLNPDYFDLRVGLLGLVSIIYIFLFWCCFKFKQNSNFQKFIAYFSPSFFGITMIYSGYTIGIYSPATMAGFISIVLVGLVFYSRKIIYGIAVPITIYTLLTCYLTHIDKIRYAPVFSEALNNSVVYQNDFWVKTMVQLYVPILIVSVLFFEVLLTQWRSREKQFEMSSKFDALTNVYNRRQINDVLTNFQFDQSAYAIILLDLDHFKNINDQYGHTAGDEVLKQVASRLEYHVRIGDTVGRYGGEEFILILDGCSQEQAIDIAERCRKAIAQQPIVLNDGTTLNVTASFGVAMSDESQYQDSVLQYADQALYMAKENGRNQVLSYPV
jgi:diguanylate cyclase (GGDEF)-like protein